VAYVLSLNLHRRHLDETQRAMVAGRSKALYEKAAKERQSKLNGKTQLPVNLPEAKGDARELGLYIQANFPECLNTKKNRHPEG
jgi:hypothetical protein